VKVALGGRALSVTGLRLHEHRSDSRRGRLSERGVPEAMPDPETLDDARPFLSTISTV
jgi:hypothetical protein